ncbi:MAG: UbiA family prenyltransferase [Planctomycetes bacterium]|nr:UbiA family prenyltransferase [Planctomycetota bacterium]
MLDWLRLIRASGLCTILANLAASAVIAVYARGGLDPNWLGKRLLQGSGMRVGWVLLASFLLYASGMLWNDLADIERDRTLHPRRPLPSGRVNYVTAYVAGIVMAVAALLVASQLEHGFHVAGVVLSLALLYNFVTKHVPWLGSLNMALVRFSHALFALLLLGSDHLEMAVLGIMDAFGAPVVLPGAQVALTYPLLLGGYVFGLTLISELESRRGTRLELIFGGACMAAVIGIAAVMLVTAHWIADFQQRGQHVRMVASLFLGLGILGLLLWRVGSRWWAAVRLGRKTLIGPIIPAALGGMILFDALIATSFHPLGGLLILMLYPVFRVVGKMIRMD